MTYVSFVRMSCFKHTDMLSKTLDEIAKTLDEIAKTLDEFTKIFENELLFLRICNPLNPVGVIEFRQGLSKAQSLIDGTIDRTLKG